MTAWLEYGPLFTAIRESRSEYHEAAIPKHLTFLVLLALFTTAADGLLALTHSIAGGLVVTMFMWAPVLQRSLHAEFARSIFVPLSGRGIAGARTHWAF